MTAHTDIAEATAVLEGYKADKNNQDWRVAFFALSYLLDYAIVNDDIKARDQYCEDLALFRENKSIFGVLKPTDKEKYDHPFIALFYKNVSAKSSLSLIDCMLAEDCYCKWYMDAIPEDVVLEKLKSRVIQLRAYKGPSGVYRDFIVKKVNDICKKYPNSISAMTTILSYLRFFIHIEALAVVYIDVVRKIADTDLKVILTALATETRCPIKGIIFSYIEQWRSVNKSSSDSDVKNIEKILLLFLKRTPDHVKKYSTSNLSKDVNGYILWYFPNFYSQVNSQSISVKPTLKQRLWSAIRSTGPREDPIRRFGIN